MIKLVKNMFLLLIISLSSLFYGADIKNQPQEKLPYQIASNNFADSDVQFQPLTRWKNLAKHFQLIQNSNNFTKDTAEKLNFFVIQYLAKVATQDIDHVSKHKRDTNPLQLTLSYFRLYENDNKFFDILDANFAEWWGCDSSQILTLNNNDPYVLEVLSKVCHICIINPHDSSEEIENKVNTITTFDNDSRMPLIVLQLPSVDSATFDLSKEEWKHCIDQLRAKYPEISLYAIGCVDNHSYIVQYKTKDPYNHWLETTKSGICVDYGFSPTLHQVSRLIGKEMGLNEFIEKINKDSENTHQIQKSNRLTSDDFIHSTTFCHFQDYADHSPSFAAGLLAKNLCNMLNALLGKMDEPFAKRGLTIILEESHGRIVETMEKMMALDRFNSMAQLSHYFDLILEEIILWLEFLPDSESLDQEVQNVLQDTFSPKASLKPAVASMVSSGMLCFGPIKQVMDLSQKNNPQPSTFFSFEDCYFEYADCHQNLKDPYMIIASPDYDSSFDKALNECRQSGKKVNLLLVDFYSTYQSASTHPLVNHDIASLIDKMIKSDVVGKQLTVAIDLTIGNIDDENLTALVDRFKELIETGRLNIVAYRSLQKLDSFGSDKLTGGALFLYSGDKKYIDVFKKATSQEINNVDPLDKKLLVHLYKHCIEGLEQYRNKIVENTRYIHAHVNQDYIAGRGSKKIHPFYLKEMAHNDRQFVVVLEYSSEEKLKHFINVLEEKGFCILRRPSFGFPYCAYLLHSDRTLRISMGIYDKEDMNIFVQTFNDFLSSANP